MNEFMQGLKDRKLQLATYFRQLVKEGNDLRARECADQIDFIDEVIKDYAKYQVNEADYKSQYQNLMNRIKDLIK